MAKAEEMLPTIWTTLWSEQNATGTWRMATPVYQDRSSPCYGACPVNGVVPIWIECLRKGDVQEAWIKLAANNPFPAVTGRVCHHPCETYCNRAHHDEKISIKLLERFVGDAALEEGWQLPQKENSFKQRVAVIGGGPAGLAAAYHLSLKGYNVEIFEAQKQLGGLLRYGIPPYRLPREILEQELTRLLNIGIKVHYDASIKDLNDYGKLQEEYDALFIATGAPRPRELNLGENGSSSAVEDGLNFLSRFNSGAMPKLGKKVAVIGGGNTAVDAARVAARLDTEQVTLLYRRTEAEMPCQKIEVVEAREEGVEFLFLLSPVRLETEKGRGILVCQKMKLGAEDASGRPSSVPINEFVQLEVDHVLTAIGSDPVLPEFTQLTGEDMLLKIDSNQNTPLKGIFAGGDLTNTDRYFSSALGDGKRAAEGIAHFFGASSGAKAFVGEHVTYEELNTFYFPNKKGIKNNSLDVSKRLKGFAEVQSGIGEEQALHEAERCFVCGRCILCDNCFYYCPDMAIKKNGADNEKYSILDQYCKGCGMCVKECPRSAIALREEIK